MANTPRPAFHFRLFVGWLLLHAGMNQTSSAQIFEYGARAGGLPTSAAQSQGYGSANPAIAGAGSESVISSWLAGLYGIKELILSGLSGATALGKTGIGIRLIHFGFDRYTEDRLDIQISHSSLTTPADTSRVGVGITLLRRTNAAFSSDLTVRLSAGYLFPVSRQIHVGIVLQSYDYSPRESAGFGIRSLQIGSSMAMSRGVSVYSDVFMERHFLPSFRSGVEGSIFGALELRGGYSTNPDIVAIGFSLLVNRISAHFAFNRHRLLGMSSSVEMTFQL
jgi:hypothetical protein